MNRLPSAALLLLVVATFGCHKDSPQFESRSTFPVDGQVLIRGKPEAGVQVFFHAADPMQRGKPRGVTDAAGRFQLRTYHDGDGAPAGEYTVTLYWPEPYNPNLPVADQMPPDRLGERFMKATGSAFRATVNEAPTTLPPIEVK
jgi:hypothetical protein